MENYVRRVASAIGGSSKPNLSISYNSEYCTICSLYIIFVYKLPEFELVESITFDKKEFLTAIISPVNKSIIAYITNDYILQFYDIETRQFTEGSNVLIGRTPLCLRFSTNGKQLYLFTTIIGVIVKVDVFGESTGENTIPIYKRVVEFLPCPFLDNSFLFCSANKNIFFVDLNDSNNNTNIQLDEVISLKFDPLNQNNCLAITKDLKWVILYVDCGAINVVSQSSDVSKPTITGDWIPAIPGQIVTGDANNAIIYFWSVSSGELLDSVSFQGPGIVNITCFNEYELGIHLKNGSVYVYNVIEKTKRCVVTSGHVNTIFQGKFMPSNPSILATASADGCVCFWDVPSLKLIDTIEVKDESSRHLYSIDFSPGGSYIVSGLDDGSIQMYSYQTKQLLFKEKLHKGPVMSVAWSHIDNNIIATTSSDSTSVFFNTEERVISKTMSFARPIKSSQWSTHNDAYAIASSNGNLYVRFKGSAYLIIKTTKTPLYDVQWSPFDDNIIASTNHDGYLILFDIKTKSMKMVKGHEGPALTALWNTQLRDLILTGGEDGYIVVWNTATLSIITKIKAHISHINSLASHKDRPFLIASMSKDSTVALWSLEKMFPKLIFDIAKAETKLLSHQMCPFTGSDELTKLIHRINKDNQNLSFNQNDILHLNDIKSITKKKAQKLLEGVPLEQSVLTRAKKSRAKVLEAADLYLKTGVYKKYCELMFICGEFDKALAAAPNVSYSFWQSLAEARAKIEKGKEGILWTLLSNSPEIAIDDLLNTNDYDSAFLLASAIKKKPFEPQSKSIYSKSTTEKLPFSSSLEDCPQFPGYEILSNYVNRYLKKGNPILAAAVFLSFGDYESAIWRLLYSGEYLWAIDLARNFDYENESFWFIICKKLIYNDLYDEAFELATPDVQEELAAMLIFDKMDERTAFYLKHNMKTTETYMNMAKHYKGLEKIKYMLVAGLQNESLQLLEKEATAILSEKIYDFNALCKVVEMIERLKLNTPFAIALSFYVAIYKALWLGFTKIIPELGKCLCELINTHNFDALKSRVDEIAIVTNMCTMKKSTSSIRLRNKTSVKGRILKFDGGRTVASLSSSVKTIDVSKESISICHTRDTSSIFVLEDGQSYFSTNEALMWFSITPFSPLPTHKKYCP